MPSLEEFSFNNSSIAQNAPCVHGQAHYAPTCRRVSHCSEAPRLNADAVISQRPAVLTPRSPSRRPPAAHVVAHLPGAVPVAVVVLGSVNTASRLALGRGCGGRSRGTFGRILSLLKMFDDDIG